MPLSRPWLPADLFKEVADLDFQDDLENGLASVRFGAALPKAVDGLRQLRASWELPIVVSERPEIGTMGAPMPQGERTGPPPTPKTPETPTFRAEDFGDFEDPAIPGPDVSPDSGTPIRSPGEMAPEIAAATGAPTISGKDPAGQARVYQAALAAGRSDEDARILAAVTETEGGWGGAVGDQGQSRGIYQFHERGEMPAFRAWVRQQGIQGDPNQLAYDPDIATRYAATTYLGRALDEGRAQGLSGSALATYVQRHGQRSVSPETTGANYERLFGSGATSAAQSAAQSAAPQPGAVQAAPAAHTLDDGHNHADDYDVAFGFDTPYDTPFNVAIPRHRGVDLVVRGAKDGGRGAPVKAFRGGTVYAVTSDPNGGNGLIVATGDPDAPYDYYGHFDAVGVKTGDPIAPGAQVGILGASGTEGFPHVHYEVRRNVNGDPMGQTIDPTPYMRGGRATPPNAGVPPAPAAAPRSPAAAQVSPAPAPSAGAPDPLDEARATTYGNAGDMRRQALGQPVPMPGSVDEQATGGIPWTGEGERSPWQGGAGAVPAGGYIEGPVAFPIDTRYPGEEPYDATTAEGADATNDPLLAPWAPVQAPGPGQSNPLGPGDSPYDSEITTDAQLYRQPLGETANQTPARDDWRSDPTQPYDPRDADSGPREAIPYGPGLEGGVSVPVPGSPGQVPGLPGPDLGPGGMPITYYPPTYGPDLSETTAPPASPYDAEAQAAEPRADRFSTPEPTITQQIGNGLKPVWDAAGAVIGYVQEQAPRVEQAARSAVDTVMENAERGFDADTSPVNPVRIVRAIGEQVKPEGFLEPAGGISRTGDRMYDIRAAAAAELGLDPQNPASGLRAVRDADWRARNPSLAAEYDQLEQQFGLTAVGQAGDASRFVQKPTREIAQALTDEFGRPYPPIRERITGAHEQTLGDASAEMLRDSRVPRDVVHPDIRSDAMPVDDAPRGGSINLNAGAGILPSSPGAGALNTVNRAASEAIVGGTGGAVIAQGTAPDSPQGEDESDASYAIRRARESAQRIGTGFAAGAVGFPAATRLARGAARLAGAATDAGGGALSTFGALPSKINPQQVRQLAQQIATQADTPGTSVPPTARRIAAGIQRAAKRQPNPQPLAANPVPGLPAPPPNAPPSWWDIAQAWRYGVGLFGQVSTALMQTAGGLAEVGLGAPAELVRQAVIRGHPEHVPLIIGEALKSVPAGMKAGAETVRGKIPATIMAGTDYRPATSDRMTPGSLGRKAVFAVETPGRVATQAPDSLWYEVFYRTGLAQAAAEVAQETVGSSGARQLTGSAVGAAGGGAYGAATAPEDATPGQRLARGLAFAGGGALVGRGVANMSRASVREQARLIANPTPEMIQRAHQFAQDSTYKGDLGTILGSLETALRGGPQASEKRKAIGSILMPVYHTIARIHEGALEYTPVIGMLPLEKAGLAAKGRPPDQKLAQQAVGVALVGSAMTYAASGGIRGPGPTDPDKRQMMADQGHTFNATNIGGYWVPNAYFGRAGPILNEIGALNDAVLYHDTSKGKFSEQSLEKQSEVMLKNVLRGLADYPAAEAFSTIARLFDDPFTALAEFAGSTASTFSPAAIRAYATANDPKQRRPDRGEDVPALQTAQDTFAQRSGIGRQSLPVAQNRLGQEIENPRQGWSVLLPRVGQDKANEIEAAFLEVGVDLGKPPTRVTIKGKPAKLSPAEQREYQRYMGEYIEDNFDRADGSGEGARRKKAFQDLYARARQHAQATMTREYDLRERAADAPGGDED